MEHKTGKMDIFSVFFIEVGTENENKLKKVKWKRLLRQKGFNCINVNKLFYHFFIKMSENQVFHVSGLKIIRLRNHWLLESHGYCPTAQTGCLQIYVEFDKPNHA
jgi:hypothetical protein